MGYKCTYRLRILLQHGQPISSNLDIYNYTYVYILNPHDVILTMLCFYGSQLSVSGQDQSKISTESADETLAAVTVEDYRNNKFKLKKVYLANIGILSVIT